MKKTIYILLIMLCIYNYVKAQTKQYYSWNSTLINIWQNPAYAGVEGKANFNLLYANDWEIFQAIIGSYDMPLLKGKLSKEDFMGIGANLYYDIAGDADLGTTQFSFSVAYHKVLDSKNNHNLSFGLQSSYSKIHIDFTKLIFDSQLDSTGAPTLPNKENFTNNQPSYFSIGTGLWYTYQKLYLGISILNINRPLINFFGNGIETRLYQEIYLTGGYHFNLSDKIILSPSFIIKKQGPLISGSPGILVIYDDKVLMGLTYTNLNIVMGRAGVNLFDHFRLSVAYGYPINKDLRQLGNIFQLQLRYQFDIAKK